MSYSVLVVRGFCAVVIPANNIVSMVDLICGPVPIPLGIGGSWSTVWRTRSGWRVIRGLRPPRNGGSTIRLMGLTENLTMSDRDELPVLIVAFRSADLLEKCLQSVKTFHSDQDVLIWDNSGPEVSEVRELAQRYPEFRWHFSEVNVGFSAAVNRLADMVPGKNFLLLNPDAELLAPLEETIALLREPQVGAAGPMTAANDGSQTQTRHAAFLHPSAMPWDNCVRRLTLLSALGAGAGLGNLLRGSPLSRFYRTAPSKVDGYIAGCCLAISREAWEDLGGFDEEFFMYGEEADWQQRANDAGWQVRLAMEVGVRHFRQGTTKGDRVRSQRSQDLSNSSLALMIERSYSRRSADLVLVWIYIFAEVKRVFRSEQSSADSRADFLITVDGPHDFVRDKIAKALALENAGHHVVVVSLQRMGTLPRELPPTIRLVRMAWWLPWLPGVRLPLVVASGATGKAKAFTRLLNLRPAARSASKRFQVTSS